MSRVYKTQQRGAPWSAMTVAGDGMPAARLEFFNVSYMKTKWTALQPKVWIWEE